MTIGISKEELLNFDPWAYDNQQDLLNAILGKCTELNPWLPIADAPNGKEFIFKYEGTSKKKFIGTFDSYAGNFKDQYGFVMQKPTHYQELPDDPK